MRTLRLLPLATTIAAMFVLGGAADGLALTVHPALNCGEPCNPINTRTILLLVLKIESFLPFSI